MTEEKQEYRGIVEDENPLFQAKQALKTARERQQGGDEWSSGYEVGRALRWLQLMEEEDG